MRIILIAELKSYSQKEVLQQVKTILTKIHDIALDTQSTLLIIQSLLFRAKFSLVEGNFQGAQYLLDQVRFNAEEWGLQLLTLQISTEQEILHNEFDKWSDLLRRNAPLRERLDKVKLEDYISKALRLVSQT